jgi:hypothetical protein
MRRSIFLLILTLAGCAVIPPVQTACFNDNRQCMLLRDLRYEIGGSQLYITVPAGFVTDFASVPQEFWSVLAPNDRYSRASVIHDYLYWTQGCTREQADNLLLIAMKESSVSWWKRSAIYEGVRKGGENAWKSNEADRLDRLPRIIPAGYRDFAGDVSWDQYRLTLRDHSVGMDVPPGKASYCAAGDSTSVPNGLSAAAVVPGK